MCRGAGQASHIMPPLSIQQWWIPGGTKNRELRMALAAENSLNSPQRRWDRIGESSNTRGVNIHICIWLYDLQTYWHILNSHLMYKHHFFVSVWTLWIISWMSFLFFTGATSKTLYDFLYMIFEQRLETIVMVTQLYENGSVREHCNSQPSLYQNESDQILGIDIRKCAMKKCSKS